MGPSRPVLKVHSRPVLKVNSRPVLKVHSRPVLKVHSRPILKCPRRMWTGVMLHKSAHAVCGHLDINEPIFSEIYEG